MNVVKCNNGHFFDGDVYEKCPHCGAEVGGGKTVSEKSTSKKGFSSWFDRDKKKTTSAQTNSQTSNSQTLNSQSSDVKTSDGFIPLPTSDKKTVSSGTPITASGVKTIDMFENNSIVDNDKTLDMYSAQAHLNIEPTPAPAPTPVSTPVSAPAPAPREMPVNTNEDSGSLKDIVKKASANEEGKTMGFFSAMIESKPSGGESRPSQAPVSSDPVVGWLVCVEGNHFGTSFNISAGKNSIGRNESNRIVLNRDSSVSREKHAIIVFEPKHRQFYLQPGDSSGLTYLNEEYITDTKKLSARDIIELGNSKLLFVPLCGEDFAWETYIKE